MPGSMSEADLILDLQGILQDAVNKFTGEGNTDFKRHLTIAAQDMGRVRPRTLLGEVVIVADQPDYTPPADMIAIKYPLWGRDQRRRRQPWASNYPGVLPRMSLAEVAGALTLWLDPAPTSAQVTDLGSSYKFFYFAAHQVNAIAANTTIKPEDRGLLLIRATVQALTELALSGINKPVSLGTNSVGNMPKNGTPAALAEQLMKSFEAMA